MKRAAILASALAVVLYTVGISAQAKPDFSGKWTLVPADAAAAAPAAPAAPAGGGGRGGGRGGGGRGAFGGMELTITQTAASIVVDRMGGGQAPAPIKYTYKLDGTESKNSVAGRGGEMTEQVAKAVWDGAKLKITTTGANGDTVQVLSMEGANLKVETTAPGFQGGAPTTTSALYKK